MLRFAVFDDAGPAATWPLRQAHLLGADAVIAPGEVTFDNGLITCDKRGKGSTALALQWNAGPPGVLTLETCLLPDRDRPYLLSLELARRRIMFFLVKLEEWSLFELPPDDPAMSAFETARRAFTEALVSGQGPEGSYSVEQDRLARRALTLAIDASERLAFRHAEEMLARRIPAASASTAQPAAPPTIGCAVFTDHFSEALRKVVAESFDFITSPMRWSEIEPEEGNYQFRRIDKWIEWAVRNAQLPVTGGPVIDFRPGSVPDWLYIWENDYDTLRELVYEFVRRVITRYRRAVNRWTIVSGLHVNSNFTLGLDQVVDLTRLCVLLVRKLQPGARVQVEITQPFGEYSTANSNSIPPLLYTELLFQAGIAVDSIGLRIEMGDAEPGRATRDMAQFADLLDRFAAFEKPISITALGAPSAPPTEESLGVDHQFDPGYWRRPWSEAVQADWLTRALSIAIAHPCVTSVCWQELCDKGPGSQMHAGGLITEAGHPKPALKRLAEIRRRLRERQPLRDLVAADAGAGLPA